MTNILVADDDPDIREMLAFRLERSGFRVSACADGPAALAAVADEVPDLVILDLNMPGMSGLDVCRALRRDPSSSAVPVVMLTARTQESDVEASFAAGADDYIPKPFSPREVVSRIEAVMARASR